MANAFRVEVQNFANILEIDGARTPADHAALLEAMEYGDTSGMSDGELREMCLLSLQDMEPAEAAYVVLKHDMSDVLRDGQARNVSNEMLDEKLWEEYADSALHERFFKVGSLLYAASPRLFPKPDAVRVTLEVTASNEASRDLLADSPNESFLARLLADGMDEHAILNRLYEDELKGTSFPNASEVVWTVRTERVSDETVKINIIGSGNWLDPLKETESYESSAYADEGS